MTPSASTSQRRQQRDDSDDENSESSFPIGYSFQKKQQQQRVVKLFKESTNRSGFGNQSLDRGKIGGLHLPPVVPQFAKSVVDTRKVKKGSSHQED
ncbi:hypothetical protein A2U01_0027987, partial [Trifolium medium]|nr:hypothetical protein [Trifolium medium]